jgi:hypothetical protein
MPNNIKWGSMPLGYVRDLSSEYKDGKSTNKLVNNTLVLVPANGYKSKNDKPQCNSNDPIKVGVSSGMVIDGKIVCQLRSEAIGTVVNYESDNETADIASWQNDCLCVLQCVGNNHLELIVELYKDFGRFANLLTIYPNGIETLPSVEEKEAISEILKKDRESWSKEETDLVVKFGLPSETFNGGKKELDSAMVKIYKGMFGYTPLSEEELKDVAEKIKLPVPGSGNGGGKGKGGYGGGSSATVNVYQNETTLEKFKSFCVMLGLPQESTIKNFLDGIQKGTITREEAKIASSFCEVFIPLRSTFDGVDVEIFEELESKPVTGVANEPPVEDNTVSTFIQTTEDFIKSTLGKETGKLPKDWSIESNVNEEWCSLITGLISNHDYKDASFTSNIRLIMGEGKKQSLVLYSVDELKKITEAMA